mmetsp:Transcript_47037/g.123432  ORF Transcript_47037/g.123432 Transcript_47037/m.123432 type:complete len:253 (+) Transcript_47037:2348-3106(+)
MMPKRARLSSSQAKASRATARAARVSVGRLSRVTTRPPTVAAAVARAEARAAVARVPAVAVGRVAIATMTMRVALKAATARAAEEAAREKWTRTAMAGRAKARDPKAAAAAQAVAGAKSLLRTAFIGQDRSPRAKVQAAAKRTVPTASVAPEARLAEVARGEARVREMARLRRHAHPWAPTLHRVTRPNADLAGGAHTSAHRLAPAVRHRTVLAGCCGVRLRLRFLRFVCVSRGTTYEERCPGQARRSRRRS